VSARRDDLVAVALILDAVTLRRPATSLWRDGLAEALQARAARVYVATTASGGLAVYEGHDGATGRPWRVDLLR